jgi:hypothetical protein
LLQCTGLKSKIQDIGFVSFFSEKVMVSDIPVQVISDNEIDQERLLQISDRIPYLMRCGIKFCDLSKEQETTINEYLQDLTEN